FVRAWRRVAGKATNRATSALAPARASARLGPASEFRRSSPEGRGPMRENEARPPIGYRRPRASLRPKGRRARRRTPTADLNKIVAHPRDGKLLKGTTQDFFPNRPLFHILLADGKESVEVRCKSLKAVFFVKEFAGDAKRQDPIGFLTGPAQTKQGMK